MNQPERRTFIKTAAAAIATAAHPILGANDRVQLGIIGLGGRGRGHVNEYMGLSNTCSIVALCDVNQAALETAEARVVRDGAAKPKGYSDMRKLFEDKGVDAVSTATPNHWHALTAIWACQAGKDVYVEKPASYNPFESQKMIDAARKYNRMVQVGSQSRSIAYKMKAIQLLHEGVIGKVYLSKGLCFKRRRSIGRKADGPVPPGINWDLFLGPAPMRPFNELRYKYNWHWFWDTGNGDIGNQGVHEMDIARWGLKQNGWPKRVHSTGGKFVYDDDQETPNTQMATFDYDDGTQLMFEVRGLITGGEDGLEPRGENTIGNIFLGSDGYMSLDGSGFKVYKGEKRELVMEEKSEREPTSPHMRNFLDAIRSRNYKDLNAEIEIGALSADLCHLANISYRVKRALNCDPQKKRFVGDEEANRLLTRNPYRAPYVVPDKV